jgi:predicted permease
MSWITRLFRRKAMERDLERELRFHLDAHAADLMRVGVSRKEALRIANRELGGVEQVKEASRDARGTRWVEDWWQDTRFALRTMRRSPAFSIAAILTLALGIGANTGVWSIVDALMIRTLPVDRPAELQAIRKAGIEEHSYLLSFLQFQRLRAAVPDTVPVAAMSSTSRMYAMIGAQPEPILTQLVSGGWFSLLGVAASHGRVFGEQDDRTLSGHPLAVLSDGFWTRRFGRDSSIIGKSVRVNGTPLTVIGVAEPGFFGLTVGQSVDVWIPVAMQHEVRYKSNSASSNSDTEQPWLPQNGITWLTLITRVHPTATAEITSRLARQFRIELDEQQANTDSATRAYKLREHLVLEPLAKGFSPLRREFGDPLLALMASVGLVLLICCGNLASLLLARSAARAHEITVRVSLGARPGRLVRQTLTESLTLEYSAQLRVSLSRKPAALRCCARRLAGHARSRSPCRSMRVCSRSLPPSGF